MTGKKNIQWVKMTKKMKARQKYLEKFYATHTYVSGGRDLGHWIPNEVREEEE